MIPPNDLKLVVNFEKFVEKHFLEYDLHSDTGLC
jgi:hypothetical protein